MMPKGIEIERKYIIHMPNTEDLSSFRGYTKSNIIQTYLKTDDGSTLRVRRREYKNGTVFTETRKIRIDSISVQELEREISSEEYENLLSLAREDSKPVCKTRHTFEYMGHTVEIDVYPQWQSFAIMEVELECADESIEFPSLIRIFAEVTGERAYSNAAMAEAFPPEPAE
jgi:CYTH domain-containing protein